MKSSDTRSLMEKFPIWTFIFFSASLIIPSTGLFDKYLGIGGVILYVIFASLGLVIFTRNLNKITYQLSKITDKQIFWMAVIFFAALFVLVLLIYPIADSGIIGGGSDNDDALSIAVAEILQGKYPYYPHTYLGNPISPLPGGLFLAIPLALLGNVAFHNIFWLFVFFLGMKHYLEEIRSALLLLFVILIFSPIVLYTMVIGTDYVSNSLIVLLPICGLEVRLNQRASGPGINFCPQYGLGLDYRIEQIFY